MLLTARLVGPTDTSSQLFKVFQGRFRTSRILSKHSRQLCTATNERSPRPMIRQFVLTALLALATVPLHATTYTLEPDYTQGGFRCNHRAFSSSAAYVPPGESNLAAAPTDP